MRVEATALEGLRRSEEKFDRAARKIAGLGSESPDADTDTVSISAEGFARSGVDYAGEFVDLISAQHSFRANLRVLATARDAEQDLLDTLGK